MPTAIPVPPFFTLLPEGKEWYSTKEAAAFLGRSTQFVRDAFERQKLLGFALNSRGRKHEEERRSIQISRSSLLLYMLEAANFRPEDYAERVRELVAELPRKEKQALAVSLRDELNSTWNPR